MGPKQNVDYSKDFLLPPEALLEDTSFNVRVEYGDIDDLAIRLMTEGQLAPVTVHKEGDSFYLSNGHRRRRAFARTKQLRIKRIKASGEPDKFHVFDGETFIREAPGPLHPKFTPDKVICRMGDSDQSMVDLLFSQLTLNGGKPFTALEKMLLVARLMKEGEPRQQIILRSGMSRTHVANAEKLHAADPRLLEFVTNGRVSQKLARKILIHFPSEEQVEVVSAGLARAERHNRSKLLPKDITWPNGAGEKVSLKNGANGNEKKTDRVRTRLDFLVSRLSQNATKPPNKTAKGNIEVFERVHAYLSGKLTYDKFEDFILGREA